MDMDLASPWEYVIILVWILLLILAGSVVAWATDRWQPKGKP
jgi:hypothetical protein